MFNEYEDVRIKATGKTGTIVDKNTTEEGREGRSLFAGQFYGKIGKAEKPMELTPAMSAGKRRKAVLWQTRTIKIKT